MGVLLYHQWGRLVAITAAVYMVWGSFWAFLFRKFFWDMIGGTLGLAGIIPNATGRAFNQIIVAFPLFQIFTLLFGLLTLAIEYPLPMMRGGVLHRSMKFKAGFYLITGIVGIMVYQLVDCSVWFWIASLIYVGAISRGEIMKDGQDESTSAV